MHILPVGLMLWCNVANLRYFLKALQTTQQTLTATVLTAASNYIFSVRLFCIYNIIGIIIISLYCFTVSAWRNCLSRATDIVIRCGNYISIDRSLVFMRYLYRFLNSSSRNGSGKQNTLVMLY